EQLRPGHRGPTLPDRPPGPHHWPMAPVDIPKPLIETPSVDVGQPDTQGKLLVTQLAGGVLSRMDQGRADAAPLQRSHDLQVMELRDAGKVPAGQAVSEERPLPECFPHGSQLRSAMPPGGDTR